MDPSFQHKEITASEWIEFIKKMPTDTLTPWVRVSNNIFHSMQWIGRDVVDKPDRRYYAILDQDKIICSLSLYRLSEKVVRTRNLFCLPEYRRQGHMKRCLELSLKTYPHNIKSAITFSTPQGKEFYTACGFKPVPGARQYIPLEYYDFNKMTYQLSKEDPLCILRKEF